MYIDEVCVSIKHPKPQSTPFLKHCLMIISEIVPWVQKHLADFHFLKPQFFVKKKKKKFYLILIIFCTKVQVECE